mgnify:CR=1 FL=1
MAIPVETPDKENANPRIGIAVIIMQAGKLLLGRRLNQPMQGSWQLPGGWLGFAEDPEQAVARLLSGFKGLDFSRAQFVAYSNNLFDERSHSVSLYFLTDCRADKCWGAVENSDCSDWCWENWDELPQPLFLPLQKLKESGFNPRLG